MFVPLSFRLLMTRTKHTHHPPRSSSVTHSRAHPALYGFMTHWPDARLTHTHSPAHAKTNQRANGRKPTAESVASDRQETPEWQAEITRQIFFLEQLCCYWLKEGNWCVCLVYKMSNSDKCPSVFQRPRWHIREACFVQPFNLKVC